MSSKEQPIGKSAAWPVLLLLACLFCWASQLTFDAGDWPSPNQFPHNEPAVNACGRVGSFAAYHLRHLIGGGIYALVFSTTCLAVLWLGRGGVTRPAQRVLGVTLLVVATSATLHLSTLPGSNALEFGHGGLVGVALGGLLRTTFAGVGSFLVLAYCFVVAFVLSAEGWATKVPGIIREAMRLLWETRQVVRMVFSPLIRLVVGVEPAVAGAGATIGAGVEDEPSLARRGLRINHGTRKRGRRDRPSDDQLPLFDPLESQDDSSEDDSDPPAAKTPRRRTVASETRDAGRAERKRQRASIRRRPAVDENLAERPAVEPKKLANWKFPPLSMLANPEETFTTAQESLLRAKAKALESALREFRLEARVVEIDTGPVITMFELELAPGIKVSQICALANDIARSLKAPSVRIIAPIPGKSTVGIEVPNVEKEKVRLKALILATYDRLDKMAIPLFLGKDASGEALVTDLATMPHMLIAGTTGSGKSVSINAIVMSILMCRRPDKVKLILIDPKMVELSHFKDVPHLMSPIVTDTRRAEQVLDWAVNKMDERYALFAEARVRNITAFNSLGTDEVYARFEPASAQEKAQIPTELPLIVIIIDELADLMMTSGKEVEHHLSRLAQKSRAVGIHIIVATQRPEAKVVTGLIKSNLPCRCAFRVASRVDSRIVLDQNGAEVLMGQGDMLFLAPGEHKPMRAQGTYVEDHEMHSVIGFLCAQGGAEFNKELLRLRSATPQSGGERDRLFDRAVRVVLETGRGSVSLLQRRLTIGYSRASRLIDQMADAGIVGDYKGSQAREVVITLEQWEASRRTARRDDRDDSEAVSEAGQASGHSGRAVQLDEGGSWSDDGDDEEDEPEDEQEDGDEDEEATDEQEHDS